MRWTVPVPSQSDFATFKIPTLRKLLSPLPFGRAVYLRPAELHALGDGALETCLYQLANHRPLELAGLPRDLKNQKGGMPPTPSVLADAPFWCFSAATQGLAVHSQGRMGASVRGGAAGAGGVRPELGW